MNKAFKPILYALILLAGSAAADEPGLSLSGSGLLTLPDTTTLAPGRFRFGLAVDNQDRDPVRLDVVDYEVAWTVGLASRLETYGHVVPSRAVSVAQRDDLYPPPVDLVVAAGTPAPSRPYYPLYAPFPYVNQAISGQLRHFVAGDLVLGLKQRVVESRGWRPALALSAEMKAPLSRSLSKLQAGAGTGAFDFTGAATVEWRTARHSFVASAAYTRVGAPRFGDRVIVFRPFGEATMTELPLVLPDRLDLGLGIRRTLSPRVALTAEVRKSAAVGGHSPAILGAGPLDMLLGAQLRRGRASLTFGVRYHANSASPTLVPSALGGLADMTRVDPADLVAYLRAIGAESALPYLRERGQATVAFPANGPPLPKETRLLPPVHTLGPHDQVGFLVALGWQFGGVRTP